MVGVRRGIRDSVLVSFQWPFVASRTLDFIVAIAHCVLTNTDVMVFIIGKPTYGF